MTTDAVEEAPLDDATEEVVTRSAIAPQVEVTETAEAARPAVETVAAPETAAPEVTLASTIVAEEVQAAVQAVQSVTEEVAATGGAVDLRQITGNRVNMRAGPGTNFGVVTRLDEGDEVEVLQEPGNGWLKLRVLSDNTEGWIADWLVTSSG